MKRKLDIYIGNSKEASVQLTNAVMTMLWNLRDSNLINLYAWGDTNSYPEKDMDMSIHMLSVNAVRSVNQINVGKGISNELFNLTFKGDEITYLIGCDEQGCYRVSPEFNAAQSQISGNISNWQNNFTFVQLDKRDTVCLPNKGLLVKNLENIIKKKYEEINKSDDELFVNTAVTHNCETSYIPTTTDKSLEYDVPKWLKDSPVVKRELFKSLEYSADELEETLDKRLLLLRK